MENFYYKENLELQWPLREMFQLDKITHLRNVLKSKDSKQNKQNGMPILVSMQNTTKGFEVPK